VLPPVAVKHVEVPAQIVLRPEISQAGFVITVNVLLQELVQPAALVTVTLYVPAAVRFLITAPVALKPPGPDQAYVPPPVAVKLVELPAHIVLFPVISQLGFGLTVSVLLHELVHPAVLVTVTLYVPAAVRLQITAPVALKPPGPAHAYVPPPVAVKHVEVPAQIVLVPETLQLGVGLTVSVLLHELVHPPALVTVTLYVPAVVRLQTTAPVAEKPPGPDHAYVLPPVAVKHVEVPAQIVLFPDISQLGFGLTVSVRLHELVQLAALVTVTL